MHQSGRFRLVASTFALLGFIQLSAHAADPTRIAVASFGEHPALNAVVAGAKKGLAEAGYVEGRNVVYSVSNVSFDPSLAPQMIAKLKAERPALMITVTTPISQVARQALQGSGIPQVFAAVTDPVSAKLLAGWNAGGPGITGASDRQDAGAVLAFARRLMPQAKRLGLPYNPGEANDSAQAETFKAEAPKYGFQVVTVGVDSVNDIQPRIASLKGKVDLVYAPASNLMAQASSAVVAATRQAGLPLMSADADVTRRGEAVASVGVSYEQVGINAGRLAAKVLGGTGTSALPPVVPSISEHETLLSRKAAAAIKFQIPVELATCKCFAD